MRRRLHNSGYDFSVPARKQCIFFPFFGPTSEEPIGVLLDRVVCVATQVIFAFPSYRGVLGAIASDLTITNASKSVL